MRHKINHLAACMALGLLAGTASAVEVDFSGFGQATIGRVTGGSPTVDQTSDIPYPLVPGSSYQNFNCPCAVGNYERAGVYEYGKTQLEPESLIGLQGKMTFSPDLTAVAQVVARGIGKGVELDWAYGSYNLTPSLTLQVGHKRLPLYYYSDFMYVGYAYPWVRPPQDLYAWQIYAYDGANLMHKSNVGDWSLTSNVWVGSGRDKDNSMLSKLYYGIKIDEEWKDMLGAYVEGTNDIVTARAVYMHTTVNRFGLVNGSMTPVMHGENGIVNGVGQDFYGFSLNADYNNWLLRTEVNYVDRPTVKNSYTAQSYSGGYQFGPHTVMLGWSQFRERSELWPDGVEFHTTKTLSYRWDYAKSQALKLQYDQIRDGSKWLFTGNADLLSGSVQFVF